MNKSYTIFKFTLFSILLQFAVPGFCQSFSWLKTAGDNDRFTWGQGVVIDHHHNEIVSGYQNDSTHFGSLIMPFYGDFDAYIAKYDSAGNVLWAKTIWGPNSEKAYHVAVDTGDNIYVVGAYSSPFVHFSATDSLAIIAGGSNRDFFIAKYDPNGNFLWARNGGNPVTGNKDCNSYAVYVDPSGNAVIGGYYQDTMTIAGNQLGGGAQNLFLAKYGPSGTCLWAKAIESNSMCWVSAITCDNSGNIYPTGKFGAPLYIGGTQVASNSMGDALFFGKFNPMGVMQWIDSIPGDELASTSDNNFNCGNSIAVDNSGNVFVGGSILDTVILIPGPSLLVKQDGFIARYTNTGALVWMKRYGDNKRNVINGVALDAAGGLYATGNYVGPTTLGGMSLITPSWGYGHIFVAKFDPATGNAVWIKTGGGLSVSSVPDYGLDISVDQQTGDIATTGYFEHQVRFESIIVVPASTALSYMDMYLTRQNNPVTIPGTLGLLPPGAAEQYAMYPNPSTGIVNIDLPGSAYHKVYIIDITGKIIKETETLSNTLQLNLYNLAAGAYTIAIADAQQNMLYTKLVKL